MKLGYWLPLIPFLASCAQVSGFDDLNFTDTNTGSASCGFTDSYPPCQNCFNTYCCNQGLQCIANEECTALLACSVDCGITDTACGELCLDTYPNGYADLIAVLDCRNELCDSECNMTQTQRDTAGIDTDTGSTVTEPPSTDTELTCGGMLWIPDTCQTCYETSCCATGTACAANNNCVSLLNCLLECPIDDDSCIESCFITFSDGESDFEAMRSCMEISCTDFC